jgi:hypothetical protein
VITLATGAVEESDVQFLDVPSWQRLAPDQPGNERPSLGGRALNPIAFSSPGP